VQAIIIDNEFVMRTHSDMTIYTWIKSNIDYGRSLLASGWEGAHTTGKSTLEGVPAASVLVDSVRTSCTPALIGAYIGALGAALGNRRRRAYGVITVSTTLGAVIGFTTGMAWGTRRLTGEMVQGARKKIDAVRDAHWLERNPIDYA
jgi:hypothetical protein